MNQFKRILVAVDSRQEHHPVIDGAVEIAKQNGASLKIMDVVPEFPWIVRVRMVDHEGLLNSIKKEKQQVLDDLATPIREQGIEVETVVAVGKMSTEIVREVLRCEHDLVIATAKGTESGRLGYFGQTATRLLRACPCPLWLVAPGITPKFQHVLGCVDTSTEDKIDSELNDKIYNCASAISGYHNAEFSIIHAWNLWNESMLKNRMKLDDFTELEKFNQNEEIRLLDEFLKRHDASVSDDNVYTFKGEVDEVISGFIRRKDIDLVVMGTVGRSGLSGAITGNTAEKILGLIECSVLALKPSSFVSPIHLPSKAAESVIVI